MPTTPSLATTYDDWIRAPIRLRSRIIAAIALVAQQVQLEPLTGDDARPNAAARRAWAYRATIDPGRFERSACWALVSGSAAYATAGPDLTDDDIIAAIAATVDALAVTG